jgi:hypothetical protein
MNNSNISTYKISEAPKMNADLEHGNLPTDHDN